MNKTAITIIIISLIATSLVVGVLVWGWKYDTGLFECVKSDKAVIKNINTNVEEKIDASDWLTYKNEEYGFEFKYPADWKVQLDDNEKGITIGYPGWRDGVPEGGRVIFIYRRDISLKDFIKEYNNSEIIGGKPIATISDVKDYAVDDVSVKKFSGSTAIGLDQDFIFRETSGESIVVNYNEYDAFHVNIVSTLKFLK